LLQNAMTEIEDVAGASESGDDFLGGTPNFGLWAEENGGVEVALKGEARAELSAEGTEIDAPVDAQDAGAGASDGGKEMMRGFGVVDDRGV
jgi:hypothetical protein